MYQADKKQKLRCKRVLRVRKNLKGNLARPRLSVFVSNQHVYAQLIDDEQHKTMASSSSLEVLGKDGKHTKKEKAYMTGKALATKAKEKNIDRVIFDRGFRKFHSVLAALKEGVNEIGIQV